MKRLVMSVAVIAVTITAVTAQPAIKAHADKNRQNQEHHKKSNAYEHLNLTEDQKAQIKANRADFKKQMKALNSNESQTVKQLRDQRAAFAKTQKGKIESVLTSEQKAKVADMKTKGIARHQERSAKHLDKMKQELSLSDNQVTAIRKNQEATKQKLKAIKENDQLDRVSKKEQLKTMKTEMKQNLDNVLTQEQKLKLESRKGEMKHKIMGRKERMMDRKEAK